MSMASQDILERKIKFLFPGKFDEIIGMLSKYGKEDYEREPIRVRLAIIKLSDGKYNKLKEYIDVAKKDYRDVLAWAEYPEEIRSRSWELSTEENETIRHQDQMQYDAWLNE